MSDENGPPEAAKAAEERWTDRLKAPLAVLTALGALVGVVMGVQAIVKSCSAEYPVSAEGSAEEFQYPPSLRDYADQLEKAAREAWPPPDGHWTVECLKEEKEGRRTVDVERPCPPMPLRKKATELEGYFGLLAYSQRGEVQIKNTGTKRIHNAALLIPLKGEYLIKSTEQPDAKNGFENRIAIGDLQPGASVRVSWWSPFGGVYSLEDKTEVHFDEGSKAVVFASASPKWIGPLVWTVPFLVYLLYLLGNAIHRAIFTEGVKQGIAWQKRKAASDSEKALQVTEEAY